ncbi:MAG: hypothetical protein IKQ44_01065 [Lachnospiraceae bacterium]|nr:hypothetical protein [Lachnospiraceae bacterium]
MKNRIVKQLLGISVATVLFAQMPMLSFAGQYDIGNGDITITATADDVHTVTYYESVRGEQKTATGDTDPVIYGESTRNVPEHKVTINADGGDAYVTFQGVNIDEAANPAPAVAVKGTDANNDVHIELNGSNILKGGAEHAGIQDELAGELIITDVDNNGSLTVTGGQYAAAIGGGKNAAGTDITISGGTVTATGGFKAAGIGGGKNAAGTDITISGGTITATGGESAAAIGGGENANGTDITISGGTITATGGSSAAAIGGGEYGAGINIKISEGEVTATGGSSAAAIGGGNRGAGTNIKISGGEVTATGGYLGSGIGSGLGGTASGITISGGTVTATGGTYFPGIGGETLADDVIISGSATVNAAGGAGDVNFGAGAAIGTASDGYTIENGTEKFDSTNLYNTGSINTYPAGTTIAQMSTTQPITIIGTIEDPNAVIPPNPSGQIDKVTVNDNNNNAGDPNNNVTSDTAPVDEAHAFVASTDAKLQEHINKILALINSGKIAEANALIANGILLDTGRWYTFNKDTCTLIEKASQLGIKVTLHYEYDHTKYSTTIPARTMISPVSLCNADGFVGFMNFYKYYGGFVRSN